MGESVPLSPGFPNREVLAENSEYDRAAPGTLPLRTRCGFACGKKKQVLIRVATEPEEGGRIILVLTFGDFGNGVCDMEPAASGRAAGVGRQREGRLEWDTKMAGVGLGGWG
ncbi:unnamed protein product [Lampetra fluviatilis]